MTPTDRPVTRVTLGAYPSLMGLTGRAYGRARVIAVKIGPGDNIELRWGGTRQRVSLPIETIMRHATRIQQRARDAERAANGQTKRRKTRKS